MGSSTGDEEEQWSRPHFFKIMKGDFSQRLELPRDFVKKIFWELTPTATLTNSRGMGWSVEAKREISGIHFTQGWSKFVDDNSVERNDFLVFRYDGNMQFNVMLFDKSACEKDAVLVHGHPQGEAEKQRHDKFPAISDKEYEGKHVKGEAAHPDFDYMEQTVSLHGLQKPMQNLVVKIKDEQGSLPSTRALVPKAKTSVPNHSGKIEPSSSKIPSFTKQISLHNVNKPAYFEIPREYSSIYLPRKSVDMMLHDPKGRKWRVKYNSTDKDFFSSGWAEFLRYNKLKEGDVCKFELVGEWVMNIQIMRS